MNINRACRFYLFLLGVSLPVLAYSQTPSSALVRDSDFDGLSDEAEQYLGTDIWLADTDGDGVADAIEVGEDRQNPRDTDGDLRIDALDVDDDGDSIPTVLELKTDTDGDGLPNYLDTDADGDGTPDREESGAAGADGDRDGVDDYFDADHTQGSDVNGDGVDGGQPLPDRDRDGIPDSRDKDDNDGLAGDLDQDGLSNLDEQAVGSDPGRADSDGDQVTDALELGEDVRKPRDTDNDGIPDILDADDDNDGLPTRAEVRRPGTLPQDLDTDQDGEPDYIDADDDGDGILTRYEDTNRDGDVRNDDSDADGTPDYLDNYNEQQADTDGDGMTNAQEYLLGSNPEEADTDNDGIADALEVGLDPEQPQDSDGDGVFDFRDADDDGDGLPTRLEGETDRDGDGRVNYLDVDAGVYFYCANNGRIVRDIDDFQLSPAQGVVLHKAGGNGVVRWEFKAPGTYTLQFVLPDGMQALSQLNRGHLYVTRYNGALMSLGRSEDIARPGYLARFNPDRLPGWYSTLTIQQGAPPVINLNIPVQGGACDQ